MLIKIEKEKINIYIWDGIIIRWKIPKKYEKKMLEKIFKIYNEYKSNYGKRWS
jgi:hypothetical protein